MARPSYRSYASPSRPKPFQGVSPGDLFWNLLTFDRLLTRPVVHLIYWSGLLVLLVGGFGVVGGLVGAALREEGWKSALLALPFFVVGMLVIAAAALMWRSVCEFYVAVFRIADDLKALRELWEKNPPGSATDQTERQA